MWRNCYPRRPLIRAFWYGDYQDVRIQDDPWTDDLETDLNTFQRMEIMSRTMDDNVTRMARLFAGAILAAYGVLGVAMGTLTNNTSRVFKFLNENIYRRDTMRLISGNANLSGPKATQLAKDKGMSLTIASKGDNGEWIHREVLACPIFDDLQRIGYVVGDLDASYVKPDKSADHITL